MRGIDKLDIYLSGFSITKPLLNLNLMISFHHTRDARAAVNYMQIKLKSKVDADKL